MAALFPVQTYLLIYLAWSTNVLVNSRATTAHLRKNGRISLRTPPNPLPHSSQSNGNAASSQNDDYDINGYGVVTYDGEGELTGNRDTDGYYYEIKTNNNAGKSFNNSHASTNLAPRKVLGLNDDRIPVRRIREYAHPYNAVVYLDYGCTGFFVGPRHILTAGHCIYDFQKKKYYQKSYVYQAKECTDQPCDQKKDNCFKMVTYLLSDRYEKYGLSEHDFALIIVNKKTKEWLELDWIKEPMTGLGVSVIGFPGDKMNHCMYASFGEITSETKFNVFHDCDTFGGTSGGPIYHPNKKFKGMVYGIHTGYDGKRNKNTGVTITENLYNYLQLLITVN